MFIFRVIKWVGTWIALFLLVLGLIVFVFSDRGGPDVKPRESNPEQIQRKEKPSGDTSKTKYWLKRAFVQDKETLCWYIETNHETIPRMKADGSQMCE